MKQVVERRNKKGQFTNEPRPERRTGKLKNCNNCSKSVYVIKSRLNVWKFCSVKCSHIKGVRMNTGRTHFKKGQMPWNKGTHIQNNTGRTHFKKGQYSLEKHPNWKGNSVGYYALHDWVYAHLPNIFECMYCGIDENLQWANVSGEYKREPDDWVRLCAECHRNYDYKVLGIGKIKAKYG